MSVNEKMTAIADTIREKTGGTEALTLDDMASGVNDVYDKGITDGWAELQNLLTNNNTRSVYYRMFYGTDFTGKTFNPTLRPRGLGYMFYNYAGVELPNGIDCSGGGYENSTSSDISPYFLAAYSYKLRHFPDIGINACNSYTSTFLSCNSLRRIEIIRVLEKTTFDANFTYMCTSLTHIRFEGIIGQNIRLAYSPLDVDSLKDVITHLKNYAGTDNEYAYTVTFKSTAFSALAMEGETSPNGNTWAEYIDDLKWNLTLA